jgi:general nucleoside transport system ATP-binding protein
MPNFLEMHGIVKRYPNGVVANSHVDFAVRKGEIHALVGENGAGKSTLMKILYGLEQPTSGVIRLDGRPVAIPDTHAAIRLGIGMVHQNFMLVPSFTVAENVVLGKEPRRGGMIDASAAIAITAQLAGEFGLVVEPAARVEATPVGMRQRVEILKALYRGADLLILDEPTAVLTPQETDDLFAAVRRLVDQGRTVIFITHKLVEVKEISDRVTVMQRGKVMGSVDTADVSEVDIARMMVGREVLLDVVRPPLSRGERVVEIRNLDYVAETGRRLLSGINLNLYAGEILGVAGVEGNGQTELAEVLSGLRRATTGEIRVRGRAIAHPGARAARRAGIAHIPEDRLANGVAPDATIAENLVVDRYNRPPFARRGLLSPRRVRAHAEGLMQAFDIRAAGPEAPMRSLSGGNMQKVIVAREFSSDPVLLIAAQPTRGIDIGATEFVHGELVALRGQGCAVLLISADLEEVLELSDRVAVMHRGRIVALLRNTSDLDEHALGLYMLGVRRQTEEEMELAG